MSQECRVCNKRFTSEARYLIHIKSKIHNKKLSRYEREIAHDKDCPIKTKCSVMNCDWCNV